MYVLPLYLAPQSEMRRAILCARALSWDPGTTSSDTDPLPLAAAEQSSH